MKKGLFLPVFVVVFLMSVSCTAKENVKKPDTVSTESSIEDIGTLADAKVFEADMIDAFTKKQVAFNSDTSTKIDKLYFPLPEKYRYYISSTQGLRNAIPNANAGGGATLSTYHNAIDIAVPDKTPVYAAKAGYVQTVYPSYYNGDKWKGHPTYGGLIEIVHPDGTTTLYAHLSLTEVREGDYVDAKQEIGWSGGKKGRRGSGNSTGPHLHFSEYVDINNQFL